MSGTALTRLASLPESVALEAIRYAIRAHESGDNYTRLVGGFNPPRSAGVVRHPNGRTYSNRPGEVRTASGAYMYIRSTWLGLDPSTGRKISNPYTGGYEWPFQAPPEVQDERARRDLLARWRDSTYRRDPERVIMGHFFPAAAGWDKSRWSRERPPGAGNPTFAAYLVQVTKHLEDSIQLAMASRAPEVATPPAVFPVAGSWGTAGVRAPAAKPVKARAAAPPPPLTFMERLRLWFRGL